MILLINRNPLGAIGLATLIMNVDYDDLNNDDDCDSWCAVEWCADATTLSERNLLGEFQLLYNYTGSTCCSQQITIAFPPQF